MASVVVAEDEGLTRLDFCEMLAEAGHVVVGETSRGDAAWELIREMRPDFALIDIKMPGLNGLELTRLISESRICPVLIVTAFSQRDLVEWARDSGAMYYLVKPIDPADLQAAVVRTLSRWREVRGLEEELAAMNDKLASREAIKNAARVLVEQFELSQDEAINLIHAFAVRDRCSLAKMSGRIVQDEELAQSLVAEFRTR